MHNLASLVQALPGELYNQIYEPTFDSDDDQDIRGCDVTLKSERAEKDPKVFTSIHFHFTVRGRNLKPNLVERAIKLSHEKYCSASIMLGNVARAVRTAAMRVRLSELSHSSSVTELDPSTLGVTLPALLISMSMRPPERADWMRSRGPFADERSTRTSETSPELTRSSSSEDD